MRKLALLLWLGALALPASGQQPGGAMDPAVIESQLRTLFSGSTYPLTMKLQDLTDEWRRFSVGGQFEMGNWMQMLGSMFGGGAASGAYYTQGKSMTIGGEVYLIAYRPQTRGMNLAALMQAGPNAKPPAPEKLTPETALSLSLVNLRTAGSLNDIRPFDLKQEIAESEEPSGGLFDVFSDAREKAQEASSTSNLKQLGLALMMYVQDYDEVLPPMKNPATVKKLLMPYVKNESVFQNPLNKQPYQPNAILTHRRMRQIASPASFVAFYETAPDKENKRAICFLDGHVKRIPEAEWPRLKQASKIP